MAEYISRNHVMKALSIFNDGINGNEHFMNGIETAKEIVMNEDAIEMFDTNVGVWIKAVPTQSRGWTYICTCCKGRNYFLKTPGRYCSQCGAAMRPYVEETTCSTG